MRKSFAVKVAFEAMADRFVRHHRASRAEHYVHLAGRRGNDSRLSKACRSFVGGVPTFVGDELAIAFVRRIRTSQI
jgi:hypothetical protein